MRPIHIVALVIGIGGSTFGLIKGAASTLAWLTLGIIDDELVTNSYLHLVLGTNALLVIFCTLALLGLAFSFSWGIRTGILCSSVGVVAVLTSVVIYVYLLPQAVPGPIGSTPNAFYYVVAFTPVTMLLITAILLSTINRRGSYT